MGNLETVKGHLFLEGSEVKDLGNLKTVGHLDLEDTKVTHLGGLEVVTEDLYLANSQVNSLGNLIEVGGVIVVDYVASTQLDFSNVRYGKLKVFDPSDINKDADGPFKDDDSDERPPDDFSDFEWSDEDELRKLI